MRLLLFEQYSEHRGKWYPVEITSEISDTQDSESPDTFPFRNRSRPEIGSVLG
jgi:hypothetical protein